MSDWQSPTYPRPEVSGSCGIKKTSFRMISAAAAAFSVGYILLPLLANLLLPPQSTAAGIVAAAGPLLSLTGTYILVRSYSGTFRKTMLELGFRRFPVKMLLWALPMAAAIMLCGGAITLLWGRIGFMLNIDLGTPPTIQAAMSDNIWDVVALMTTALLAAPLFEEIFFRRMLYGALLRITTPVNAAMLASLAFSAMHMSLLQLPGLWLIGWIWQNFYKRSQTLWSSVILHFCNNLIAAAMLLLMRFTDF